MPVSAICLQRQWVFNDKKEGKKTVTEITNQSWGKQRMKKLQNRREHMKRVKEMMNCVKRIAMKKEAGIDGILVTVGLCIIALLLCVVMKDSLASFIQTIVTAMQEKANAILTGV